MHLHGTETVRVCLGVRGGLFGKREGGCGRKGGLWEGQPLGSLFFFIIQNPPNQGGLQICIVG